MGTGLLLFGSMALFLIIGVPIAFALGAAVWTTIVFSPDFLVTTGIIGQRIFGGLDVYKRQIKYMESGSGKRKCDTHCRSAVP